MSEHLSDLMLDEVAVGGPRPVHLEACAACLSRLERLTAHAGVARARPGFSRVRAQVLSEHARLAERKASRWRFGWMLVPALAAAMAMVLWIPAGERGWYGQEDGPPGIRLKGAPSVELLRLSDGEVNPVLAEGDQVALRLRGGGYRFALVVSVDASGQVEQLWPSEGGASGELAENPPAPLFQVTEGDFVVHAFYSETPLGLDEVRDGLAGHAELPPGAEHASVTLRVERRR
ncbi:hypothetical protein [Archangium violaceum]|uniref:hypothetical protein n=1 Tax=Archangium violaceum TaxID=83451 RepID=UPI0036D9F99A